METITIGSTGITVKRLGFGGIPIQRIDDDQEAADLVRYIVDQGVDFIDTARAYTTSEQRIGLALQNYHRPVAVASESQARTSDGMRRDIDISLENLGLSAIDLYQCHFVKDQAEYRTIIGREGALSGLRRAQDEGLIHHIGITSHSLDLLETVLDDDIFDSIMVCYSFLEPAAAQIVIPKARAKRVGVIAMKPFSGGALYHPRLALKYVLSQPGIVIIPGVEDAALFDANWEVFRAGDYHLSQAEKTQIAQIQGEFEKRFCRRCDYCQPCTEDISIQAMLGLRFAVKRFGRQFLENEWVKTNIANARNCSACGECMERCPYDLPIPELMQDTLQWLDQT